MNTRMNRMNKLLTNIMELPKYEECMEYKELYNQLKEGEPIKKYYEDQLNIFVNPALEILGFTDDGLAIVAPPANFDPPSMQPVLSAAPPSPHSDGWTRLMRLMTPLPSSAPPPAHSADAIPYSDAAAPADAAADSVYRATETCIHDRKSNACRPCFIKFNEDRKLIGLPPTGRGYFCEHGTNTYSATCLDPRCNVKRHYKKSGFTDGLAIVPPAPPAAALLSAPPDPYSREWFEMRGVPPAQYARNKYCTHGRRRTYCKDCGGTSICEHDKRRSDCKDCGGSNFCQHGNQKSRCKECGGVGICIHDREKRNCKICGGTNICQHGMLKYNCINCKGTNKCKHGREKRFCKDCGGSGICKHGNNKRYCKVCNSQGGSKTIKSKKSYRNRNVKMSFRKNKKVVAHKKTKRLKSSSASSRKSHVYI